jgi:hypothetical protein
LHINLAFSELANAFIAVKAEFSAIVKKFAVFGLPLLIRIEIR